MKKVVAFICSIIICFSSLAYYKYTLEKKIANEYYDKFGDNVTKNKFKSIILQKNAEERDDTLTICGSSEIEASLVYKTNPFVFFKNKRDGFQINAYGNAGYTSLVQAVNLGSLGSSCSGKKVAIILSPQWFTKKGVTENMFESSSSELQVASFFFSKNINIKEKEMLANRIITISKDKHNKNFEMMRSICRLYINNNKKTVLKRYILYPYFWMRYEMLSIKDDINADKLLSSKKNQIKYIEPQKDNIDWKKEISKVTADSAKKSNNNRYGFDNDVYTKKYASKLKEYKNSAKNDSYRVSPEYDDLKLMLQICKDNGIKPLIINVPVNGYWYDFAGFDKNDRQDYYKKVSNIIKDYGFEEADFSNHEYDKNFFKDPGHLGEKGCIYVDQAIDEYYNEN
ncbi:MAG: D-alanyl-lipoteichoic acid biosynthesis protein DltD [Bacillota bacterium]|nr:D-alanyl-lipoteichoic acid biosynthesis protein DltD [Bacillota bacterium]